MFQQDSILSNKLYDVKVFFLSEENSLVKNILYLVIRSVLGN